MKHSIDNVLTEYLCYYIIVDPDDRECVDPEAVARGLLACLADRGYGIVKKEG